MTPKSDDDWVSRALSEGDPLCLGKQLTVVEVWESCTVYSSHSSQRFFFILAFQESIIMSVTPRRSTRGALFTPSPHPSPAVLRPNTIFSWTSAPLPSTSTRPSAHYKAFTRIVTHSGLTPRKGKARAGKGDEESRFTVGDGVLVSVEGGGEGVGVLIRLWEEEGKGDDTDDTGDEGGADTEDGEWAKDDGRGTLVFPSTGPTRSHEEPRSSRCELRRSTWSVHPR